jgi:hypothetical protein
METDRVERWIRLFAARVPLSRRGLGGLTAGALSAPALVDNATAKKKRKKKKTTPTLTCPPPLPCPTCPTCTTPATPTCRTVCPQGADYCLDGATWGCGHDCGCATGSSRTICGRTILDGCIECTTDAQCEAEGPNGTGPGSVCGHSDTGGCECDGKSRVCIPPCPNPIPIQCS